MHILYKSISQQQFTEVCWAESDISQDTYSLITSSLVLSFTILHLHISLQALYACSGGSRHANAHADAPTRLGTLVPLPWLVGYRPLHRCHSPEPMPPKWWWMFRGGKADVIMYIISKFVNRVVYCSWVWPDGFAQDSECIYEKTHMKEFS